MNLQTRKEGRWKSAFNMQDVVSGSVVMALGLFAVVVALFYPVGSVARMGPGFFPLLLGSLLLILGLGIILFDSKAPHTSNESLVSSVVSRFRALALSIIAPIVFALLIEPAGLAPSVFLAVFISTFADKTATLKRATVLSVLITALCVLVFKVALNLSIDVIG